MIKFLLVSDTHEAYDLLREVVSKESGNIDYIIHSGDFSNITYPEKDIPEVQAKGLQAYVETISILKSSGKPVICVPGNVISI